MPIPMPFNPGAGDARSFPSQAQGNPMMNAMNTGSSPNTAIGIMNPAGRAMPAQAIANAQGQPFQPGGAFNPMAQALAQPPAPPAPMPPQGMPQGFPSQAMGQQYGQAPNMLPQGFMQNAMPQMNPQTLAFLQSLFARR